VFAGYHLNDYSDVRFSYWHLDSSTDVSGAAAPGQVIVDPFGNLAPLGTTIDTTASVRLNVFDLEYQRRIEDFSWPAGVTYSAGLRFADLDQFYESSVSAGGLGLSDGVFRVNWFGVGPYGSLTGRLWLGEARRLSLFAKAGGALLVGKNDITTDVSVTGAFTGGQSAGRILVVPVLESELGGSWQPSDRWRLSAGWLVQAWFDLGVSGGTFSGQNLPAVGFPPIQNVFGGADDSNIMAFDGLFLRAEYNY
jgi:Legionella pneumophila major outer membrane protein precursor